MIEKIDKIDLVREKIMEAEKTMEGKDGKPNPFANKITVAVVGLGRIGRLHCENLVKKIADVHVKWVVDPMHESAETSAWLDELRIPQRSDSIAAALQDDEVQAVFICSPTDTHAETIEAFAKAKKPIFCEKPIDLDARRIVETLKVVEDEGVKLHIGFNRRYDRNFAALREKASSLGDMRLLRITSRDPAPPPMEYVAHSGGMFLDMTIHDFDMIRFISQSEVVEVSAMGDVLINEGFRTHGDIDSAVISMQLANGALVSIDNSREVPYGYDQRLEVVLANGTLIANNAYPNTVTTMGKQGVFTDNPLFFFIERYEESYLLEAQDFFDCLRKDTPVAVSGEDGLKPVLIALAAKKALKEKRTVTLKEIENEVGL